MNALIFLFGFVMINPALEIKTISLEDAILQKIISAEAIATGSYSEESVKLTVTNKSNQPLKIVVPAGFSFYPQNKDEQTLITTEEQPLLVDSQKSKSSNLKAFCSEHHNSAPSKDGKFKFGKTKIENLRKLTDFTAKHKIGSNNLQESVWAVANGRSISNISMRTPEDKALRVFVAEMLGIKDNWYSSPQENHMDENRNIVSETLNIEGDLVFSIDKPTVFRQEVRVKGGEVKVTSQNTKPMPKGNNIEYKFSLKVKGWKKGEYEVVLLNAENKVIGLWPFTV